MCHRIRIHILRSRCRSIIMLRRIFLHLRIIHRRRFRLRLIIGRRFAIILYIRCLRIIHIRVRLPRRIRLGIRCLPPILRHFRVPRMRLRMLCRRLLLHFRPHYIGLLRVIRPSFHRRGRTRRLSSSHLYPCPSYYSPYYS